MKVRSFVVFAFFALSLMINCKSLNCVHVKNEETEENREIITSTIKSETDDVMKVNFTASTSTTTTIKATENSQIEGRSVDEDDVETTEIIPPTLMNVRAENKQHNSTAEKSAKVFNSLQVPRTPLITQSQLHTKSLGHVINSRVKQAFLNSRQNTFERLNQTLPTNSANDQVAKPAEVSQVSLNDLPTKAKEIPPTTSKTTTTIKKEFYPSPEVNPIYNYESNFNPMNTFNFNRNGKPDAQYPPSESAFSHELNTNWNVGKTQQQPAVNPQFRNANIDLRDFYHPHLHHQHHYPGEKIIFPDEKQSSVEQHTWPPNENIVPALNFKKPKGVWKWIPDEDDTNSPETSTYSEIPTRPTLTHIEHPYSFENFKPKPTSSYPWTTESSSSLSIPTDDYLRDEVYRGGSENHHENQQNNHNQKDINIHRKGPSPWKKIIHVMAAAVPIGLIISALTPRIVYVHPNASTPSFLPPIGPAAVPPNLSGIPPTGPPQPGGPQQFNGPYSPYNRQRSLDSSLIQFMKTMEMQFKDKHQRNGEKFNGKCEDRFFCEVALMGRQPKAETLHRMLYNVALETPDEIAKKSGLGEIFTAIKRQNCDVFKCKKIK